MGRVEENKRTLDGIEELTNQILGEHATQKEIIQALAVRINESLLDISKSLAIIADAMDEKDALNQPEIVRCKDCKHKHIESDVWVCPFGLPGGPDFFCGFGAKMEVEHE